MSRESIKQRAAEAQAEIDAIISADELTYASFTTHVRTFVLKKFALEPSDFAESDDLTALSTLSLARTMAISKDLIAEYQAGETCDGATSTDVKRTLLLVRIQKSLDIKLTLQDLMQIETVEDLCHVMWPYVSAKKASAKKAE